MKKYIFIFGMFVFFFYAAAALEVDRAEIESAGAANSVVFVNYSGPHQVVNTADQIRNIGSTLAAGTAKNPERESASGQQARYYIIHAVDPAVSEKLDADILMLGGQAQVDHIDNIRRIIAGYLEKAYGYSRQDSQTLAVFVTVYNAVYRGKTDVFNQKYKTVVTKHLASDKAGLSLNYTEWPGKTQIVIPLSDIRGGGIGTVDTSLISDTKVIDSMKKESDKGIDDRKNLVTIKEKEAEQAQLKAEDAQKKAADEKKKAEELKKAAEDAKKEANANPADKAAQKKAEEAKKQAEEAEKKADALGKTAEKEQLIADKKQAEAQKDRIEIAKDQQQLIREAEGLDNVIHAAYGLKVTNEKEQLSGMVLVDTKTGRTVKESAVTVIRNRVIYSAGKDYIAVAGKTGGNAAVRLVKLDSKNMEIIAQSEQVLAPESVLVKEGDFYYVIIQDGKNYVTAKYDSDLKLVLKSNVAVLASTPVTVSADGIMVTDTYGFAKLLKASNLQGVE